MDSAENNKKRTYNHKKLKYKVNIYDNDKKIIQSSEHFSLNHISKNLNLSTDTCYRIKNNYYNNLKKKNHKKSESLRNIEIVKL